MWKRVALYGLLLATGTLALQWLEVQRMARLHSGEFYVFLIALGFLALGVFVGMRLLRRSPKAESFDGNPKAQAALGISPRELTVLQELAAGHSNKDIAASLFLSERTVARHLSNIYTKIGVSSRSAATAYAFEHGLVGA